MIVIGDFNQGETQIAIPYWRNVQAVVLELNKYKSSTVTIFTYNPSPIVNHYPDEKNAKQSYIKIMQIYEEEKNKELGL